jgi:hypothetical protein
LTRKDLGLILDYVVKSRYGKEMKKWNCIVKKKITHCIMGQC